MKTVIALFVSCLLWLPSVQAAPAVSTFVATQDGKPITVLNKYDYTLRPIASLTKLMTAFTLLSPRFPEPEWNVLETVTASDTRNASWTHLSTGDTMSRSDLFYLMLVTSDNVAARVLARTTPNFIRIMNILAFDELDTDGTFTFVEPSGLRAENRGTAKQVGTLVHALLPYSWVSSWAPAFRSESIQVQVNHEMKTFRTTDKLVTDKSLTVITGKTGYTDPAGYCWAGVVQPLNGRPVIVVVLGAPSSAERFRLVKRLAEQAQKYLP